MKFNAEPETLDIQFEGAILKVRFPTIDELQEFQAKMDKAKDKDAVGHLKWFLDKLGLPKNLSGKLQAKHLNEIVQILSGAKKN